MLPSLSVGEMTLRLYAALNYSQNRGIIYVTGQSVIGHRAGFDVTGVDIEPHPCELLYSSSCLLGAGVGSHVRWSKAPGAKWLA